MKIISLMTTVALITLSVNSSGQTTWTISSPGDRVKATVQLADLGGTADYPSGVRLYYTVSAGGPTAYAEALQWSPMGLVRSDQDFVDGLSFVSEGTLTTIDSTYTMVTGKRSVCRNYCNEKTLVFQAATGSDKIEIVLRAYDDGFAFRYRFPETNATSLTMTSEATGFRPPAGSIMWMLAYNTTADTYAPAYEDLWNRNIEAGSGIGPTAKPSDSTWCMPALYKTPGGCWALLWETDVTPSYCNCRLSKASQLVYRILFPNANEVKGIGAATPSWALPWTMPWRLVITGTSPGVILESTLSTDCASSSTIDDVSWIHPGRSSWSWWSANTSPRSYNQLKTFVDLAQEMTWEYSIADANWNLMTGGTWQELVTYAAVKNVGINLWYNSGGAINDISEGPRDRIYDSVARDTEFNTISAAGVKGVKIDFWLSDKQNIVKFYCDVLRDAAKYHLLVNPHGSTIPRGWQRTYPNLITAEAIRGAENYIWFKDDPARLPWQNTIVPFTRNAVASMDWTPVTFTNNTYAHLTTYAHELALSVVFESGIQHFADRVSGYSTSTISAGAIAFLKQVPAAWDDTKYLLGYPGSFVVLARRKGFDWYIGGITGDTARSVTVPLPFLTAGSSYQMTRIADGTSSTTFGEMLDTVASTGSIEVSMPLHGGFVARLVDLSPAAIGRASVVPRVRPLASGNFLVSGESFALPGYAGKPVLISIYSLNGSLLKNAMVDKRVIRLKKELLLPVCAYIIRAREP